MKTMPSLLKITGIGLIVVAAVLLIYQGILPAQETRVVRIWGRAIAQIEPPVVLIPKGTTVIWFNVSNVEVKIIFEEGKKCDDVTDAPTGFTLDAKNCYVTTWLPYGATTSLKFNEPGTFDYVVEYGGRQLKGTGKIVVD